MYSVAVVVSVVSIFYGKDQRYFIQEFIENTLECNYTK